MRKSIIRQDEIGPYIQIDGDRARPSSTPTLRHDQTTVYQTGERVEVETLCAGAGYVVRLPARRREEWSIGCWYENGGNSAFDRCLTCCPNHHTLGDVLNKK